jgi:hypothetical protein
MADNIENLHPDTGDNQMEPVIPLSVVMKGLLAEYAELDREVAEIDAASQTLNVLSPMEEIRGVSDRRASVEGRRTTLDKLSAKLGEVVLIPPPQADSLAGVPGPEPTEHANPDQSLIAG